jgi:hypothetical protein
MFFPEIEAVFETVLSSDKPLARHACIRSG